MIPALEDMMRLRFPNTLDAWERAFKEVLQQCALVGLQEAGFFRLAAFYGGSALRLFHGLDRFSEDLDFTLLKPDPAFRLNTFFDGLRRELSGFGLEVDISSKNEKAIESAFIKANTQTHLIQIHAPAGLVSRIPGNRLVKVKFEIDIDPPALIDAEVLSLLEPFPFSVRVVTPSQLFAGKLHACICRGWKERVKGRDWYDLLFFVRREIPADLQQLAARLRQSGHWTGTSAPGIEEVRRLFNDRITSTDWSKAVADVSPFVTDRRSLNAWSTGLFTGIFDGIRWVNTL